MLQNLHSTDASPAGSHNNFMAVLASLVLTGCFDDYSINMYKLCFKIRAFIDTLILIPRIS